MIITPLPHIKEKSMHITKVMTEKSIVPLFLTICPAHGVKDNAHSNHLIKYLTNSF